MAGREQFPDKKDEGLELKATKTLKICHKHLTVHEG